MRIGVLGSWRPDPGEWDLRGTREEFESACKVLGKELARRGQTIIVGGEAASTADYHVVRGVLEILEGVRPEKAMIEVIRPADENGTYLSLAAANPGVFGFHLQTHSRWTEAHLLTVREADCVLVVGGMKLSYHAGLAAIVARKPLVPVGSFGGAASRLLRDLAAVNSGIEPHETMSLNGPWDSTVLEAVLRRSGIGRRPRLMLVHGRSPDLYELQSWLLTQSICDVLVMQQAFGDSRTFPEKFERIAAAADGAVVLATPDDVGALAGGATTLNRARQNVWVEVGWFWGHLGRSRLLLLLKGEIEVPSDLLGVEFYHYQNSPTEQAEKLRLFARRLTGVMEPTVDRY